MLKILLSGACGRMGRQVAVLAEDEQACLQIGWNPYHVEKGYDINTSVITCGSTLTWGNPVKVGTTDPDKALQLLSWDVTEKQQNGLGNTNPREARMIWLTKDTAATIAQANGCSSKTGLKDTLINTARRPLWMRTYAHYWANTGSKIHLNTTFDQHYNDIKRGVSTENVERDYVSATAVPEWLRGVVPYSTIDTTQTIEANNTGFVITGGIFRAIGILWRHAKATIPSAITTSHSKHQFYIFRKG